MSQGVYAGLNEDSEPEQDIDDPEAVREFSGVSGSLGSSPAKLSQPLRGVEPEEPLLLQAGEPSQESAEPQRSADGLYHCPNCTSKKKKTYKTLRGYEKHQLEKHSTQNNVAAAAEPEGPVYPCLKCNKPYKTYGGMINHLAGHKIEELNNRKPKPSHFSDLQMDVAKQIISEMLEEPRYGEMSMPKVEFLTALQNCDSADWLAVVNELCSTILPLACNRDTRMPLNQYEKTQGQFNSYLNDVTFQALATKFQNLGLKEISADLAGRLLTRFSFKLMDKIQFWIAKKMKDNADEIFEGVEEFIMDPIEEKAFKNNLGEIFRGFYKKGLRTSSTQWQSQSACLKETFVFGPKPIISSTYLNKNNWFSGERNSIVPSDNAVNFFMGLEKIIRTSPPNSMPTTQDVIQKILLCVDSLNVWYFLTNDFFSEEASFLFMREIIVTFVTTSTRLATQMLNRMREKDVRASTVSLREHLNKNYVEKASKEGTEGID